MAKTKIAVSQDKRKAEDAEQLEKDGYVVYAVGLYHLSVCATLNRRQLVQKVNISHPTGISSRWQIAKNKKFATGQPHPMDCPDHKGAKHYLLVC